MARHELKEINRMLKAITPGDWHAWSDSRDHLWKVMNASEGPRTLIAEFPRYGSNKAEANAAFMAASPKIIRGLVARVEQLEIDLAGYEADAEIIRSASE